MRRLAIFLCLLLLPAAALADSTGALNGRVVDVQTQQPLANVLVDVVSRSAIRTTHTDARGYFVILNLPPDTYRISFSLFLYQGNGFVALAIPAGEETHVQVALKREFWLIDGLRPLSMMRLLRPGVAPDIYEVVNSLPVYGFPIPSFGPPMNAFNLLPNVPGITFGIASPAIRTDRR